jgi:hypothetical protein
MAGQRRCARSLPNFSGPNAIDRMRSVHQEGKAGATAAQRNRFNPAREEAGRWTGIEAIHPAQDASIGVHRRAQESSLIAPTRKASQGRRWTGIEAIHPAQDASIGVTAVHRNRVPSRPRGKQGSDPLFGNRSDSSHAERQGSGSPAHRGHRNANPPAREKGLGHRPHTGHEFEPSPREAGPRVTTHASVRPLP